MDNNLRKNLYELIEVLKDWQNNLSNTKIKDINGAIYPFLSLLIKKETVKFPLNIPEFIRMLENKALVELGFTEEEATIQLLNEKIIVNGRLNYKFIDWYENIKSLQEVEQKEMLEFLLACRQHRGKDNQAVYSNYYRDGRLLVNKDNMIMTNIEFSKLIINKFPAELKKIIKSWRRDIDILSSTVTTCPVCGKKIENDFGKEGKCSDICSYYINKDKLNYNRFEIKEDEQYSQFTEGIYRYILLPNIGEKTIYDNIKRIQDVEIELYPNMDEYDMKIIIDNDNLFIDVKDVQEPSELVKLLKSNNSVSKLVVNEKAARYLVIPEHRRQIYLEQSHVDYKKELIRFLENEEIPINVLYEKELYKKIKQLVNDDF
ncbi:hypothetical protein HMPREF1982_01326 [Clostridiales bacterium oral taxon 876 str. F0540]|nr:hypothetical protein HMPREF1982_01326 [Clostridiales bacterium oral taxon 876 str. F0540]